MRNRKAMIEAALFMATEPLSIEKMAKMFKIDVEEVKPVLEEIKAELSKVEHGIHLIESSVGYRLVVKPEYVKYVSELAAYRDLSRGLLRVLALVAYKQPITQSQIVKVIGNRTYEYVKQLTAKGLITTVKSGRTKALVPTKEFAEYFGLESCEDAKRFFEEQFKKGEKNEGRDE